MSELSLDPATAPFDGEGLSRELRLQLEAVKARMAEHRETMEAVGLAAPRRRDEDAPAGSRPR